MEFINSIEPLLNVYVLFLVRSDLMRNLKAIIHLKTLITIFLTDR